MKKSYKNIFKLSAVTAVLGMPVALMANPSTITLEQRSGYSYLNGGEFTAVTSGNSFVGNGYVTSVSGFSGNSGTGSSTSFQTFCVESTVDFNPGVTYDYTLSSSTSQHQVLTEGAAYLYYEFATGKLSGYDYSPGSTRSYDAGELQAAIWYLMGNQSVSSYPYHSSNITTDPFYKLALTALGSYLDDANGTSISYGVDVLQLTCIGTGAAAQNQLVLTGTPPTPHGKPVPDNFTTVIYFGASLAGLFLIQARRRQLAVKRI